MAEDRHPGITMHKITFGGGFIGLLFAAGSALIFLLGFPTLWYFVAFAFALGIGIAILFRLTSDHRSQSNKPLSIVSAPERVQRSSEPENRNHCRSVPNLPRLAGA